MRLSAKYLLVMLATSIAPSASDAQSAAPPNSSQAKSNSDSPSETVIEWKSLAGHRIAEQKIEEGRRLTIDGRKIADESSFRLDLQTKIGDYEIDIINGDSGPPSCLMEREYLIAAKPRAEPEIHSVDNETCAQALHLAIEKDLGDGATGDAVVIWQSANPAFDGHVWRFDPSGAADAPNSRKYWSLQGTLTFSPRPGTTFADLKKAAPRISLDDFLENEEAYKKFRALTGDRAPELLLMSTGASPDVDLSENGRFATANACAANRSCEDSQLLIVADFQTNSLFVAFKPSDTLASDGKAAKIEVFPAVGKWPPPARKELAEWAKQWPG